MRKTITTSIALFVLTLTVGACAQPQEMPPTAPTNTPHPDPPHAAVVAKQKLSETIAASPEEISIISFERMDWPNACLGLEEEGEMCAQVLTPGWRVILSAAGEQYTFRTDEEGQVVRQEKSE